METEKFVLPFFQDLKEQEAKFILDHAEKMLKDTLDTNTLIVSRVTTLTTVTSTLMIALFGYSINRYDTLHHVDNLVVTAIAGLVYLLAIAILLFMNVKPNGYYSLGAEPKDLFNKNLFFPGNRDYRIISLYVNEIHECQARIAFNKGVNEKRWNLYKTALVMLVFTPVLLTLVYGCLLLFGC